MAGFVIPTHCTYTDGGLYKPWNWGPVKWQWLLKEMEYQAMPQALGWATTPLSQVHSLHILSVNPVRLTCPYLEYFRWDRRNGVTEPNYMRHVTRIT